MSVVETRNLQQKMTMKQVLVFHSIRRFHSNDVALSLGLTQKLSTLFMALIAGGVLFDLAASRVMNASRITSHVQSLSLDKNQ